MVMTLLIAEPVAGVVNSGVITACLFISIVAAGGGASGLCILFGKEPSVSHAGVPYTADEICRPNTTGRKIGWIRCCWAVLPTVWADQAADFLYSVLNELLPIMVDPNNPIESHLRIGPTMDTVDWHTVTQTFFTTVINRARI